MGLKQRRTTEWEKQEIIRMVEAGVGYEAMGRALARRPDTLRQVVHKLRRDGRLPPDSRDSQVSIHLHLTPEQADWLARIAAANGTSISATLRALVKKEMSKDA